MHLRLSVLHSIALLPSCCCGCSCAYQGCCVHDQGLWRLDAETMTWAEVRLFGYNAFNPTPVPTATGTSFVPRYAHSATLLDDAVVVHGGKDGAGHLLDDVFVFEL